ncbi:IS66 family insertion sequence element accessory protein TnpB [Myxococcota bacterium]|nr:IS66 family insertion sequence element accessory protein TnpB [Myxococcota bacterium]
MLSLSPAVRIHLAVAPTDMRKGIDGLLGLVAAGTRADPYSGHLFVFLSRRRDQARILFWDRGGFVLYCKRLERGCFRLPTLVAGATSVELEGPQLVMLLDGIDLGAVRPVPRWRPPVAEVPCRI